MYLYNIKFYGEYSFWIKSVGHESPTVAHEVLANLGVGARVYYRDLRKYLDIDRSEPSTIGHSPHEDEAMFSRRFPKATTKDLIKGW